MLPSEKRRSIVGCGWRHPRRNAFSLPSSFHSSLTYLFRSPPPRAPPAAPCSLLRPIPILAHTTNQLLNATASCEFSLATEALIAAQYNDRISRLAQVRPLGGDKRVDRDLRHRPRLQRRRLRDRAGNLHPRPALLPRHLPAPDLHIPKEVSRLPLVTACLGSGKRHNEERLLGSVVLGWFGW